MAHPSTPGRQMKPSKPYPEFSLAPSHLLTLFTFSPHAPSFFSQISSLKSPVPSPRHPPPGCTSHWPNFFSFCVRVLTGWNPQRS